MTSFLEKLASRYLDKAVGEPGRRPATPREIAIATGQQQTELIDGVAQYPVTDATMAEKADGFSPRGGKRA